MSKDVDGRDKPGHDVAQRLKMPSTNLPKIAVAEQLAQNIAALDAAKLPPAVRRKCEELLIDVVGLAVTARNEDYVKSVLAACDDDGPCTTILIRSGHVLNLRFQQ